MKKTYACRVLTAVLLMALMPALALLRTRCEALPALYRPTEGKVSAAETPTPEPTIAPTPEPTPEPTIAPTPEPTPEPTIHTGRGCPDREQLPERERQRHADAR